MDWVSWLGEGAMPKGTLIFRDYLGFVKQMNHANTLIKERIYAELMGLQSIMDNKTLKKGIKGRFDRLEAEIKKAVKEKQVSYETHWGTERNDIIF